MERPRILFVEDDDTIALGVIRSLQHAGYEVRHHDRAEYALDALTSWAPHLIVLDVMLPGISGLDMLRYLRQTDADTPVILLTARTEEGQRVDGLDAGADDYITKPFSVAELLARVRARLRTLHLGSKAGEIMRIGEAEVDMRKRLLRRDGVEERLTTHEAGVLNYLVENEGKDVTREELLEKVWGYAPTMQTRTVDNQILKLRKKIERTPGDPRHILTIHGVGYRFEP